MIPPNLNNPELNEIRRKYQAVTRKLKVKKKESVKEMPYNKLYKRWEENSKC